MPWSQRRVDACRDVPALSGVASQLTSARLRSIIDHGLGESKIPTKPYMPVWGEVISKQRKTKP
jgi:hypothetical protein